MPDYYPDLFTAVRGVIGTAWPEVKANGIYDAKRFARVFFDVKASQLPLVVMDFDLRPSNEWGASNDVEQGTVSIYRLYKEDDDVAALLGKLQDLRNALWPDDGSNPLTTGQVMEYPAVSWSINLPMNQLFLSTQRPFYCGAVIAVVQAGETP